MESLTKPIEERLLSKKDKSSTASKLQLGKDELEKLTVWLLQIEASAKGYLNLTRSDLVNYLIREHKQDLSQKAMQQIRQYHYDPVRHLNWITPRLKEALAAGDMAQVALLQEELRGIQLTVIEKYHPNGTEPLANTKSNSSKPRATKIKKNVAEKISESTGENKNQVSPPEG